MTYFLHFAQLFQKNYQKSAKMAKTFQIQSKHGPTNEKKLKASEP
jgi:hypothetical protein